MALEEKKPKSWYKSVSAFANTFGGALIFGISNEEMVVGLENPEGDAEKISEVIKTRLDPMPEFKLTVVMSNLNYDVSQDFEENETMSELERTRMQIILHYLDTNTEINSSIAAKLLKVEIKTASRLLLNGLLEYLLILEKAKSGLL